MEELKKKVADAEQVPQPLNDQELAAVDGGAALGAAALCGSAKDSNQCQSMAHCRWEGRCKPKTTPF